MPTDPRVHVTLTDARHQINDPHRIVPRGAIGAFVQPLDLQIRFMHDFDSAYYRDRVCADLFANGQPLGIHARAVMEDSDWRDPHDAIARYGPDLERAVLNEFSASLSQRGRIDALEVQAQRLHEELAALRRPWWRKAYDRLGSWIDRHWTSHTDLYDDDTWKQR